MARDRKRKALTHGRPKANREKTPRYLIVTNGEVTEEEYFQLRNRELGRRAALRVKTQREDPLNLARYADHVRNAEESRSGEAESFAKTFVVTDVDDFTLDRIRKAQQFCDGHNLIFILTNPCFEVWLVDHEEVCRQRLTSEAKKRAAELGIVTGDRNKRLNLQLVAGKIGEALENAGEHNTKERLLGRQELRSLDFSPWTDLVSMTEVIGC